MKNRRRPRSKVTSQIEDAGLFKREVRTVVVELIPVFNRSSRGDLLISGIVQPETEIEVVIAGRRMQDVHALADRMKRLRSQAVRTATNGHQAMLNIRRMRLRVQVRGAWRLRFEPDESGWEVKSYQLLAAQWSFFDLDGMTRMCGWPPVEPENRILDRAREARARLAASQFAQTQRVSL
ncbi:hypothetical protein [Phaeobacter sp.]|uniref:hypothetical protein n=1 Tax=Phaeobacter sp. TaxID=1902409 RepID=UPI0025D07782|nr:hypothetical protein [Phaeobacter sp.]